MNIKFSDLDRSADTILDAALDPTRWRNTLMAISEASGSTGAIILPIVGRSPGIPATDSVGSVLEDYFADGWNNRDFRVNAIPYVLKNGVAIEHDFTSDDYIKDSTYYKMLEKYHLRWSASIGFKSGNETLFLVLQRTIAQGPFDRAEAIELRKLQGRLSMAGSVLHQLSVSNSNGISDAFDISGLACLFFDRNGLICRINETARKMLGPGFQLSNGELRTWKQSEADMLRASVRSSIARSDGSTGSHGDVTIISRPQRSPLVVRFQRLGSTFADLFSEAVAMAIINDPLAEHAADSDVLMRAFDLTRAEAAVAVLLGLGKGPREIAMEQDVTYETIRTHVASIFRKTDTNRQSALTALLAKFRI